MGKKHSAASVFRLLKLLKKTVAIEWQEIQFVTGNQVFGFWHEDSFLMNLVLEELSGKPVR